MPAKPPGSPPKRRADPLWHIQRIRVESARQTAIAQADAAYRSADQFYELITGRLAQSGLELVQVSGSKLN